MSAQEVVAQTLKDRLKFDEKGDITNAEEATGHTAEETVRANTTGDAATETPKIGDQATTEAEKQDKPAAAEEGAGAEEDNPYDSTEGIAAKDLRAKIEATPELKQALESHPELRNQIFANARLAARVGEYENIFMSPQEAQVAAEAHGSYSMLSSLLGAVSEDKPETGDAFVRAMVEQTYLRDEEGNVLKNDKGEPRSSGAVGRLFKAKFGQRLAVEMRGLREQFEAANARGDDDLAEDLSRNMEHLEYAATRLGLRAPVGADEDTLPEEVKREKAALKQQKDALDQREQQHRQQLEQNFNEAVEVGTQKVFDAELEKFLAKATGLDDHNRATATRNVKLALEESIGKNGYYATRYDNLMARAKANGFTPTLQQKLIALNLEVMRDALRKGVANKALLDAGAHVIAKQNEADTTQAARETASRGDTRTALGTSRPAGAMTTAQLRDNIVAEYKAQNGGDLPTQEYILSEQIKRGLAARATR